MNTFFHITFVIIFVLFCGIRAAYQKKANKLAGTVEYKEDTLVRRLIGLPFMLLLLVFVIRPSTLTWFTFSLPQWAQWLGLALGIIIAQRLKNEEALMVETFGDKYRSYMQQTGRFLPKLSQ
jgi:protein-S-isoprenylcysteine O-methyltransferase Ste14